MLVSERGRVVPCMQCRNFIFARKRCTQILLHSARNASDPHMQGDRNCHFSPRKYSDTRINSSTSGDPTESHISAYPPYLRKKLRKVAFLAQKGV